MKKLLSAILIFMLSVFPFGCDEDKEEDKEPQLRDQAVAGEMMPEEDADMGLEEEPQEDPEEDAGAEEEDLEAGDQGASDEDCECESDPCSC